MAAGGERQNAGRKPGSRNRRTQDVLDALGEGLSPIAFMLETLRNPMSDPEMRQWAAEKAAPYLHARPSPAPRYVSLELPKTDTAEGVRDALAKIVEATAAGEIAPADAQSLVAVIETQRKAIETVDFRERLEAVEAALAGRSGRDRPS